MRNAGVREDARLMKNEKLCRVQSMIKGIADWLEKISAGSMLIGLWKDNTDALWLGIVLIVGASLIRWRLR